MLFEFQKQKCSCGNVKNCEVLEPFLFLVLNSEIAIGTIVSEFNMNRRSELKGLRGYLNAKGLFKCKITVHLCVIRTVHL